METATKTAYQPRIVRGRTELWVPYGDSEIAFVSPKVGPNTYRNVGKEILENGQKVPTGDYTASLIHSAYCDSSVTNEPEFKDVKSTMGNNWLWVFNRNLWTSNGVYSIKDEKAIGRSEPLAVKDLEKMLKGGKEIRGIRFSKDEKVGFAPKGSYKFEENAPQEFSENGFIIAVHGIEGAKKLGEVSSKFRSKPYVYGIEVKDGQTKQTVSAVGEYGDWLGFSGSYWVDGYCDGYGFGVSR